MRKIRKQPISQLNSWDFSLEPGNYCYFPSFDFPGFYNIWVIKESTGRNKRDAGELTKKCICKKGKPRLATCVNHIWYWID